MKLTVSDSDAAGWPASASERRILAEEIRRRRNSRPDPEGGTQVPLPVMLIFSALVGASR